MLPVQSKSTSFISLPERWGAVRTIQNLQASADGHFRVVRQRNGRRVGLTSLNSETNTSDIVYQRQDSSAGPARRVLKAILKRALLLRACRAKPVKKENCQMNAFRQRSEISA
jgi:hypothetical protein